VLVRAVLDNTPAQKAGMKAGDIITKVDGMTVTAPSELSSAVRGASSKKSYAVDLMRDRKPMTLTVTVEDRSEWFFTPRGRIVTNSN
jgi:S1-C subfamily serine protease